MDYNIDKNAHYFILTRPLDYIPLIGFATKTYGIGYPEVYAEFKIVEENYKLEDGYKVELRAINPIYGKETFYQDDFESMVESGNVIVKKTNKAQHVEEVTWHEPLCGNVYLVHTASVIVYD
jgi:hypothetical protein